MHFHKGAVILAAVSGILFVSACGGGGGGVGSGGGGGDGVGGGGGEIPRQPATIVEELETTTDGERLLEIVDRADTLLIPSRYIGITISAGGHTVDQTLSQRFLCVADTCSRADDTGMTTTTQDTVAVNADLVDYTIGSRAGFSTLVTDAELAVDVPDLSLSSSLDGSGYGFWGQHGFAALEVGSGPLSGETEGTSFTGQVSWATAYVLSADVTGTNPTGAGSATWNGIAEAASLGTFQRLAGTATLTVADLSQPRVGVAIDLAGSQIGAAAWADMALTNGGFDSGTEGTDHIQGNFHGPNHGEAYGTFDTSAYVGVFGAKRAP